MAGSFVGRAPAGEAVRALKMYRVLLSISRYISTLPGFAPELVYFAGVFARAGHFPGRLRPGCCAGRRACWAPGGPAGLFLGQVRELGPGATNTDHSTGSAPGGRSAGSVLRGSYCLSSAWIWRAQVLGLLRR